MDSKLGRALSAVAKFLSDRHTRLRWKVEARLDAKGVDLADSQKVHINVQV